MFLALLDLVLVNMEDSASWYMSNAQSWGLLQSSCRTNVFYTGFEEMRTTGRAPKSPLASKPVHHATTRPDGPCFARYFHGHEPERYLPMPRKKSRRFMQSVKGQEFKYGTAGRNLANRHCFVCQKKSPKRRQTQKYCRVCLVAVCPQEKFARTNMVTLIYVGTNNIWIKTSLLRQTTSTTNEPLSRLCSVLPG
jgi:hypothetical protein